MTKQVCPGCGGDMWDNRPKKATGEFSAKSPDFKCKDKNCGGVIWPGETVETHFKGEPQARKNAPQSPPPSFNGLDERQRAIIRQHSQSMSLALMELKSKLGELTVEDLTPAKLRALADFFDADVLGATQ